MKQQQQPGQARRCNVHAQAVRRSGPAFQSSLCRTPSRSIAQRASLQIECQVLALHGWTG